MNDSESGSGRFKSGLRSTKKTQAGEAEADEAMERLQQGEGLIESAIPHIHPRDRSTAQFIAVQVERIYNLQGLSEEAKQARIQALTDNLLFRSQEYRDQQEQRVAELMKNRRDSM